MFSTPCSRGEIPAPSPGEQGEDRSLLEIVRRLAETKSKCHSLYIKKISAAETRYLWNAGDALRRLRRIGLFQRNSISWSRVRK